MKAAANGDGFSPLQNPTPTQTENRLGFWGSMPQQPNMKNSTTKPMKTNKQRKKTKAKPHLKHQKYNPTAKPITD